LVRDFDLRHGKLRETTHERDGEEKRSFCVTHRAHRLHDLWQNFLTMKAIQVSQTGGPEVLVPVDLPAPKPKPDEAVVQLKAAGVNFIDVYFREGRYPAQLPFI